MSGPVAAGAGCSRVPALAWLHAARAEPSRSACLHRVQVLILSPTRELAQQTEKVILTLGEYMSVQAHACIGGKSLGAHLVWYRLRRSSIPMQGSSALRALGCNMISREGTGTSFKRVWAIVGAVLMRVGHPTTGALLHPRCPRRRGHPQAGERRARGVGDARARVRHDQAQVPAHPAH